MTRSNFGELEAIARLAGHLGGRRRTVRVGIGDDAAVLEGSSEPIVATVDAQVEHVHFEREWLGLDELGERAVHVAVSDLAAMGARPLAALASLVLPSWIGPRETDALGRGQAAAAKRLACPVVGGNISRGSELVVSITALGCAPAIVSRHGARVGDELWVVGALGAANAGLRLLQRGARRPRLRSAAQCVQAWRGPRAKVAAGLELSTVASAMIDVSDGMARDLGHLARASRRKVVIEESGLRRCMPRSMLELCRLQGWDPLHCALHGGEDYALLACGRAGDRPRTARCIGRVLSGSGVWLRREHGEIEELSEVGFDHLGARG